MTEHKINLTALAESLKGGAHSIFSASGSAMWAHCAGSLLPNIIAPDDSGIDAAMGTVAHGVGEEWLRSKIKPTHLVGTVQRVSKENEHFDIEITLEMLNYVEEYVTWCAWLPGRHFIETKVYYSEITPIPMQGGTADHVACTYQRMVITDYKHGKGVQVFAKGNTQGLLYALGFFYEWDEIYDFQEIEIRICQPRMMHMDSWTITRAELLEFAEWARPRALAAWSVDAPRTPGEKQCAFCRVKASCAAHFHMQVELSSGAFEAIGESVTVEQVVALKDNIEFQQVVKFTDVQTLSTAEMAQVYQYRSLYEGWWKSLHNELNIRAAAGETIPGMKLVEARSKRVIRDHETLIRALALDFGITRDQLVSEEMPTLSKLEAVLRKAGVRPRGMATVLDPLVRKPAGKPTLVPNADRRPAIVDLSEIAFSDLDLETEDETQED